MADVAAPIYFQHEHHNESREKPEKTAVMQEKALNLKQPLEISQSIA